MKNLLLDFGATYIKTAIHNTETDQLDNVTRLPYPGYISKGDIWNIIETQYKFAHFVNTSKIYYTTQTGGEYKDEVFYNWIYSNKVGELSSAKKLFEGLWLEAIYCGPDRELAFLGSGATEDNVVINIGTGGQIMWWFLGELKVIKYLPGGWYLEKFDIEKNIVYRECFFNSYKASLKYSIQTKVFLTSSVAKKYAEEFKILFKDCTIIMNPGDETLEGLRILSRRIYDGKSNIFESLCAGNEHPTLLKS